MFINWIHYTVPKISFLLSLIFNPLFIYLIYTNKKGLFGSYKYLLTFFAIFNLLASTSDFLIPVCVFCYRYAFVTFVTEGFFSKLSIHSEWMLAYRCTFVSGTYGILNVHFVFRYLTLNQKLKIVKYFMPFGLIISIIYVLFHMIIWGWIDYEFLYGSAEKRDYIRIPFKQMYNESVDDIDLVSGLFSETTPEISQRSWTGIVLLTVIASYSIILYFVLGHKIVKSIDTSSITMSKQTTQMQKQLFRALFLQTIIPICVSFLPCSLSFYGAALRIDFMNWVYWGSSVAVSMFPFLDPMAIIFCLPALRRRIVNPCKSKNSVVPVTNHVSEASNVQ